MNTLPLEVVEHIAKLDNETWYLLVQVYKFLSEKNNVENMKRRFLLCSSINTEYNKEVKYKYNSKFHTSKDQRYSIVYYLPNGDLHTFEDPCETLPIKGCYLNIWFKDNKIHRDNNEPALISVYEEVNSIRLINFPVLQYLYHLFNKYYHIREDHKMWFKNGNLYRDNDLPVITIGKECKFYYKNGNILRVENDN